MARKKTRARSHYQKLRRKWLARHRRIRKQLHQKHQEAFLWVSDKIPAKEKLASTAVGTLMLSSVLPTSTVLGAMADTSRDVPQEQQYLLKILDIFREKNNRVSNSVLSLLNEP